MQFIRDQNHTVHFRALLMGRFLTTYSLYSCIFFYQGRK